MMAEFQLQTESVKKKTVAVTRFTSLFDIKEQEQGTLGEVSELRAIRGIKAQSLWLRQTTSLPVSLTPLKG